MFKDVERTLCWDFTHGTDITLSGVTVRTPDKQGTKNSTAWMKFLIQVPLETPKDCRYFNPISTRACFYKRLYHACRY